MWLYSCTLYPENHAFARNYSWLSFSEENLCREFSVTEAALLILGLNPSDHPFHWHFGVRDVPDFTPLFKALCNSIKTGELKANIQFLPENHREDWGPVTNSQIEREPDWQSTTLAIDDIRLWLQQHAVHSDFFFKEDGLLKTFLPHPSQPNFAPELYVAIKVWQKAQNRENWPEGSETPKQAIEAILKRDHPDLAQKAHKRISIVTNYDKKGIKEKSKP